MQNLTGITDADVIRAELLQRGRAAGDRVLSVRGVELVAAITGTHPTAVEPVPQPEQAPSPVGGQQTTPPADPPRTTNRAARGKANKRANSKRSRKSKKK